jgi:SPP1 gp7 family putative phage head morphogenesis protein
MSKHPLQNPKNRKVYYRNFIKKSDRKESVFRKKVRGYFKGQLKRVIKQLRNKKDFIDDIFDDVTENNIAINLFIPVLEKMLIDSGQDARDLLEEGKDFVYTTDMRRWLDEKVDIFTKEINDVTFDKLKQEFQNSLELNEDRKTLEKRIMNVYDGYDEKRSKRIARTEVQGVTQKGTFEGYKQTNIDIKIWVATSDSRTRDSHAALNGEEKPLRAPFSNGLMHPGDPSGSAAEIINCRCTI